MYRSLHPKADIDRLYWKRSEGGLGLQSIQEVQEIEIASLGHYLVGKEVEELLKEVLAEGVIKDNRNPKMVKRELVLKRKEKYGGKKLHPVFDMETKSVKSEEGSWEWLKKGYLKN